MLERARAVAQAELELARARRAKIALIERASAFGELDPPQLTATRTIRHLNALLRGRETKPIDGSAAMPSQEPGRSAEAVRRVLPELRKLDRYERRAAAQRDRAVSIFLIEENAATTIYSCINGKTNPILLNRSNGLRFSNRQRCNRPVASAREIAVGDSALRLPSVAKVEQKGGGSG